MCLALVILYLLFELIVRSNLNKMIRCIQYKRLNGFLYTSSRVYIDKLKILTLMLHGRSGYTGSTQVLKRMQLFEARPSIALIGYRCYHALHAIMLLL